MKIRKTTTYYPSIREFKCIGKTIKGVRDVDWFFNHTLDTLKLALELRYRGDEFDNRHRFIYSHIDGSLWGLYVDYRGLELQKHPFEVTYRIKK